MLIRADLLVTGEDVGDTEFAEGVAAVGHYDWLPVLQSKLLLAAFTVNNFVNHVDTLNLSYFKFNSIGNKLRKEVKLNVLN